MFRTVNNAVWALQRTKAASVAYQKLITRVTTSVSESSLAGDIHALNGRLTFCYVKDRKVRHLDIVPLMHDRIFLVLFSMEFK